MSPGRERLTDEDAARARTERAPDWDLRESALERTFRFPDFASAWAFATRIALLAERRDHHPDLQIGWGRVAVRLTTHSAGGLSENDVEMAVAIDRLA